MKKLALLLILLVACQFGPVTTKPQPLPNVYTGTSALTATFSSVSQKDVRMCQQSNVFVSLQNSGAFEIENGIATFIVEEQYVKPLGEKVKTFALPGRSEFDPRGGYTQLQFRLQSLDLPENIEQYPTQVIFRACYPFKTFAAVPVCVDPDVQNLNPKKVCRAEPVTLIGGQGAPVAVTRVIPLIVPKDNRIRPVFELYLQRVGEGEVVSSDSVELACGPGQVGKKSLSYVNVKAELQGVPLQCVSPVRLKEGEESKVVCDSDALTYGVSGGTFTAILNVELDYGFVNTAVLPFTISRLQGQESCK